MFKKLFGKKKDKEIDYQSLNEILSIGSKLAEIVYVISIIAIVLLGIHLIKDDASYFWEGSCGAIFV